MEIKRKIYGRIKSWKEETKGKKALLIEGARRIGKSTVAEEFGKNEYETYIIIDFNKASKKIREAFDDLNKKYQDKKFIDIVSKNARLKKAIQTSK